MYIDYIDAEEKMKYHSPIRIVIIALLTFLVFALISLGAVFLFSSYSPTALLVSQFTDNLAGEDDISFSFSSIERNIMGNITLSNVSLATRDHELFRSERVRISSSFFSIILSLIKGEGEFNVDFFSPVVDIESDDIAKLSSLFSKDGHSGASENEERTNYSLNLHFHGLYFSFDDIALSNAEIYLKLDSESIIRDVEFRLDSFSYDEDEIKVKLSDVSATIHKGIESYEIRAGLEGIEVGYKDYGLSLSAVALSSKLNDIFSPDLKNISLSLSLGGGNASYTDEFYTRLYPASINYEQGQLDGSFSLLVTSYHNYAMSLSDFSISYDLDSSEVNFDSVNTVFYEEARPLLSLDNTLIDANLETKEADITINEAESHFLSSYLDLSRFELSLSAISARIWNEGSMNISMDSSIGIDSSIFLLDGTRGMLSIDSELDSVLENLSVRLNDINIPAISKDMDFNLNYFRNGISMLDFRYSNEAYLNLRIGENVSFIASINDLKLYDFLPLIEQYVPFLENYVDENTHINAFADAALSKDENSRFGYSGDISYASGLEGIRFMNFSFNVGSSMNATLSKDLDISSFNITTDLIRLEYSGSLHLDDFLPDGELIIENTGNGNDYVTLSVDLNREREYAFDFRIPLLGNGSLGGIFNFEDSSHLFSDATLYTDYMSYEFAVDIDFNEKRISIDNDNASFYLEYGDEIESHLGFDSFPIRGREADAYTRLNGMIDFNFDVANQRISSEVDDFIVRNIFILPGSPDMTFSSTLDNYAFHLYDITFSSPEFQTFEGEALYTFENYSFALSFLSPEESVEMSIVPYSNYITGIVLVKNLDARRLGFEEGFLDVSLSGRGADFETLSFSGDFHLSNENESNPLEAEAGIFISSSEISISDFTYRSGNLSLKMDEARLDSRRGEFRIPLSLSYSIVNRDRAYPIDLDFTLSVNGPPSENLYMLVNDIISYGYQSLSGSIELENLVMDNTLHTGCKSSTFRFDDGRLLFSGDLLDGSYSIADRKVDIHLNLLPVADLSIKGDFMDDLLLDITIDEFSLYSANLFIVMPVVSFTADSIAKGELTLIGQPGDMHLYGKLWSERIDFEVFWLPGEKISAHDMSFTVWDNAIESATTSLTTVNEKSGKRSSHSGRLCFYLNPSMGIDYYTVDVHVDEGSEIDFRLPMKKQNIDIVGRVSGDFHLNQRGMEFITLSGDMSITDTQLSFGLYELPEWFDSRIRTAYDFNINLVRNNTFVFPLGPSPILSATADENQFLHFFTAEDGGLGASGAIDLRAGEIYYFQRSFFIREGNINFRDTGLGAIDPVVNLRASLRAFDSEGDQVDIYLVLREASLSNFTPTFESSPAKDLSEIMNILGQAIVSNDGSSSNWGSVVSILTTGVDVLQRMGIISRGDNGLQMSIRNSLNLDTFSLHTNIIGNLVYDAVLSSQNATRWNISPLARYLDGTALYIGKYITPELYLEALAHLSAQRNTGEDNVSSFLSSDLSLDVEISLEWENPLCTVTFFTQPRSLTIDDAFRYLGLTFSKRFVF